LRCRTIQIDPQTRKGPLEILKDILDPEWHVSDSIAVEVVALVVTPIVAGIVKMNRATFMFYNIVGSICWVTSMMLGGYFLQAWVETKFGYSLKDHIETITIVIILVTTLPVLYKLFFGKKDAAHPPK